MGRELWGESPEEDIKRLLGERESEGKYSMSAEQSQAHWS